MSNNSFRLISAGKNFLSPTDFIIQVDTSQGAVEIVMPKIATILASYTTIYQYIGIRFIDISNNASVNNITITGFETDTINGATNIVLNTDGIGGSLELIGDTQWAYLQNRTSFIPTSNYGLYAQTQNSTPITATISELSLIGAGVGTLFVPANTFQVGDSFVAKLIGHLTCVGTATIQIKVKSGSVILADTGIIDLDATTNKHWNMDIHFTIRALGIAGVGSIASGGLFSYVKNSGVNFEGTDFSIVNSTTFNTTILNTLDVTAQWNTTNAGNTIYSELFTLNKIY
jgi:hypothetical protein